MFTVSANMKMQDIWFLLLISAIWAELRLVGDIKGFSNAKTVVIHYDILSSSNFCQITRYSVMLSFNHSIKLYLTPHNTMIYVTIDGFEFSTTLDLMHEFIR